MSFIPGFTAFLPLAPRARPQGTDLIPTHQGELQYCMRGCYSSVAKFKYAYRRCENLLGRAETTDAVISALTKRRGSDLARAWDGILFNTFHDILPGSSIERAFDDQIAWLGDIAHAAQEAEFRALIALAACVDTRVAQPPPDHPPEPPHWCGILTPSIQWPCRDRVQPGLPPCLGL